ncbi:6-phosphofructo-2-kinase/fructose-2,6-bisphosphatase [Glycine max]|nr:6-phosphofructo-2-kinase/fructose-2,6-bisphosphatase [Glycine max]
MDVAERARLQDVVHDEKSLYLAQLVSEGRQSEAGELYSKKLAKFVGKCLKSERVTSIWTSTLERTILTATPIIGFPKIQWRALDEINTGVCDAMAYAEIKKNMPEEYEYVCRLVISLLFAS